MKVLAINGSTRPDGNTAALLGIVTAELEAEGIETETLTVGKNVIAGCIGCRTCGEKLDRACHGRNDFGNECIAKALDADGLIIASPVYYADVTASTKALIERIGMCAGNNRGALARKVGAAVVAVRRGGAIHALDTINHLFQISQMVVPGSSYWNLGIGRAPGEVASDEDGIRTMQNLGRNMAWVLKKLNA